MADVLRVKRRGQAGRATGTFAFHNWIRDAMATDMPYDQFVRDIVCATGDELKSPPTVWYKEVASPRTSSTTCRRSSSASAWPARTATPPL